MNVLLVDDEVELARAVAEGLERDEFSVTVCHEGAAGLEAATSSNFDVIVLDVLMPEMNGFQVCRELRARGVDTPVMMLTAKNGEWDQAEAFELGADDFLTKPFSFVVLAARLKALLRRSGIHAPTGRLVIDAARREVSFEGSSVQLTAREFSLLSALAAADSETVAKPDLLSKVWGETFTGDANVVEVYVRYLRRKLSEIGAPEAIRTVRGSGYRLTVPSATR
jgi:two-component system OmpR family response regulator